MSNSRIQHDSLAPALFAILFILLSAFQVVGQHVVPQSSAEKGAIDSVAKELLPLLGKQIWEIRANQIDYIAEEVQRQEEFDEQGKAKRQRQLLSNYYRVRLDADIQLMSECREVISVDGKPVGDGKRLQQLLLAKDKSIKQLIHKTMDENKRYNLGASRSTNQPFAGLRFADRDRHSHAIFYVDPAGFSSSADIKLYFCENDEQSLFQYDMPFSKKPMPAEGYYLFASENKQFLGYDISIHNKNGTVWSRIVARYSRMKDGKLLPASFEEYSYHKNGQVKTHSVSEYRNYRHFTVDTKIIHFESLE
jgi:hypothetical protein